MTAPSPDQAEVADALRAARHALKNDHAVALGYVELLLDGRYGDVPAAQRAALEEIRAALRRAHHWLVLAGERAPADPTPRGE